MDHIIKAIDRASKQLDHLRFELDEIEKQDFIKTFTPLMNKRILDKVEKEGVPVLVIFPLEVDEQILIRFNAFFSKIEFYSHPNIGNYIFYSWKKISIFDSSAEAFKHTLQLTICETVLSAANYISSDVDRSRSYLKSEGLDVDTIAKQGAEKIKKFQNELKSKK